MVELSGTRWNHGQKRQHMPDPSLPPEQVSGSLQKRGGHEKRSSAFLSAQQEGPSIHTPACPALKSAWPPKARVLVGRLCGANLALGVDGLIKQRACPRIYSKCLEKSHSVPNMVIPAPMATHVLAIPLDCHQASVPYDIRVLVPTPTIHRCCLCLIIGRKFTGFVPLIAAPFPYPLP